MAYPAPFVGPLIMVEDQWTDFNHHLNMAYYHVIFDRAGDHLFEEVGLGPHYVKTRNGSTFTLESHITYLQELHAGTAVRVESQLLDLDPKRVHYVQKMFHDAENYLSSVTEIIIMHVDMGTKRSAPFPPDVMAKLQEMYEAHKGLPVPPQVGHVIGIPRKAS